MVEFQNEQLINLFLRHKVLDMPRLMQATGRSTPTVFRYLKRLPYLASYSHAGRYYTLQEIPSFNSDGIWHHKSIGFSHYGTLKATIAQLVNTAEAGRTQAELRTRLKVRVQNTLLDLVREQIVSRQFVGRIFLYVSADSARADEQLARRREQLQRPPAAQPGLIPHTVINVLLEVIHGGRSEPQAIALRLQQQGMQVSVEEVTTVFARYDLGKKN